MTVNRHVFDYKKIITDAIVRSTDILEPEEAIKFVLSFVGEHTYSHRIQLYELNGSALNKTYEWVAADASNNSSAISIEEFNKSLQPDFLEGRPVIVSDISSSLENDCWQDQNTDSFIAVPLSRDHHLYGFIKVDDPPSELQEFISALQKLNGIMIKAIVHRNNQYRIADITTYDQVSGVYSNYYLLDRITSLWKADSQKRRSVIYFNISRFKIFNETYGLRVGNIYLRKIAKILREIFETDNITRFSGDHFVIFYEGEDEIEKIKQAHDAVLNIYNKHHLKMWLEAGIYYYEKGVSYSNAWDYAKIACDHVRKDGVNYYHFYDDALRKDLKLRKYIQDNVRSAINNGYLEVYYQPVIRSISGHLASCEALSRWNDPRYGMLSPGVFVPALEEVHESYLLYQHVVDVVTQRQRRQLDEKVPIIPVSINISREDFEMMDPLDYLEKAVKKNHLERWMICVEITESVVMSDPEKIKLEIEKFRSAGYEVWMDDFGSAYSSLNTLKNFDFSEIKLDMLFMRDFDEKSKKIITSIINMAKKLGIHTLAEGVETKEQFEFLRDNGCEKIQGFYFSRPLPFEELVSWRRDQNMLVESHEESQALDSLNPIEFSNDEFFGIVIDRGKNNGFKPIYMSPIMKSQISNKYLTADGLANNFMNNLSFPFAKKFRRLSEISCESSQTERLEFAIGKQSYYMTMRKVSELNSNPIFLVKTFDISNEVGDKVKQDSNILHNLINMFENIYLVDAKREKVQVLVSNSAQEQVGINYDWDKQYLLNQVHPDDRKRISKYCSVQQRVNDIANSGYGYYNDLVRWRQTDGSYQWTRVSCMIANDDGQYGYLICLSPSSFAMSNDPALLAKTVYNDLLENGSEYLNAENN